MRIGGYIPLSLVDYPHKPAITVFTRGCNLRCPFCHNGELVIGKEGDTEEAVLKFLRQRRDQLDAICISGGEPTIQSDLDEFIRQVRALGYSVKLDTNGSRPEVLLSLLSEGLLDYVAIDIKSSPHRYRQATGGRLEFATVAKSVGLVRNSGTAYELRTTVVPGLVDLGDLEMIAKLLGPMGRFALQQFRPRQTLDPAFGRVRPYAKAWFQKAKEIFQGHTEQLIIRGL
ncbi:MAG: anaerobic ribonucleoside-triphosphate reductase activating protein [Firmicutes bacterium]|nr:anaerobic ribonucleoside-triphosphate reductase activating protein [Bacillota bacterium]